MSTVLNLLEYELMQSLSKVENLSENIESLEEELEHAKKDLAFQQNKIEDLKVAIQKIKE